MEELSAVLGGFPLLVPFVLQRPMNDGFGGGCEGFECVWFWLQFRRWLCVRAVAGGFLGGAVGRFVAVVNVQVCIIDL